MDKQAAGRIADARLAQWQASATYAGLAWADHHRSSTTTRATVDGVTYDIESTVWLEQRDTTYVMAVRVTESGRKRWFGGSVTRHGRMFPDGRYVTGL